MILGIISDTHGTLYKDALDALKDADHIVHAGDIGAPEVLQALQDLAPIHAVRGNMDGGAWCEDLPGTDLFEIGNTSIYLLHNLETLDLDPPSTGIQVVISGHTHQPANTMHEGVLYFNPGTASFRRRGGPLSVGRIEIIEGRIVPEIIVLDR